jgi:hypothetical protein
LFSVVNMTIFYSFLRMTAWASQHWSKLFNINAYSRSLLLQHYLILNLWSIGNNTFKIPDQELSSVHD